MYYCAKELFLIIIELQSSSRKLLSHLLNHTSLIITHHPMLFLYPSLSNCILGSLLIHCKNYRLIWHLVLLVNQIKQVHTSLTIANSLLKSSHIRNYYYFLTNSLQNPKKITQYHLHYPGTNNLNHLNSIGLKCWSNDICVIGGNVINPKNKSFPICPRKRNLF